MKFVDRYEIHEQKAKERLLTVHPSRWLYFGRHLGLGVFNILTDEEEAVQVGAHTITRFRGLGEVDLGSRHRRKHGYYFATAAVAERYRRSSGDGAGAECAVRDMLAVCQHEAEIEVSTPVGRIDLLLSNAVVEVKRASGWKEALGQVQAYSYYYPEKAKVIHLLGEIDHPELTEHVRICNSYGVVLRYQCLQRDADGSQRLGSLLTGIPPSSGQSTAAFAACSPPLMSNVRVYMSFTKQPVIHANFPTLTKRELHDLADGLLVPEPWIVERCVGFILAETRGLWHGRARAIMCRRLKHCDLGRTHRTALLKCILGRLADGSFSEQFKDQLRLARHLDPEQTRKVAQACVSDPKVKSYAKRYAEWVLSHKGSPNAL